jgi:hypothetical protein
VAHGFAANQPCSFRLRASGAAFLPGAVARSRLEGAD